MNARMMTTATLGCLSIALLNGCTTNHAQTPRVAFASMDSVADPLCLASGDTLGMELHVWHVVSTEHDTDRLLAVGD